VSGSGTLVRAMLADGLVHPREPFAAYGPKKVLWPTDGNADGEYGSRASQNSRA
jgi:hypothetical protein